MFGVTGLHFDQLKSKHGSSGRVWAYRFNYSFWTFNWLIGHITGGIVFLGLLGWLGSFLSPPARIYCIVGLGVLCFAATLHQFKVIQLPMPQIQRQVSRLWLPNFHKNLVAFGYGFQLGSGVATRIKIATTYIVIGCAFCSGSLITGAIIGGVFGFSRAVLPIVLAPYNTVPGRSLAFALKFNSFDEKVQKINGVALFLSGLTLGFSTLMPGIEQIIK